jgi:hypothetical protein
MNDTYTEKTQYSKPYMNCKTAAYASSCMCVYTYMSNKFIATIVSPTKQIYTSIVLLLVIVIN